MVIIHPVVTIFIVLQIILLILMPLHDWIHIPPLTNIRNIEKHSSIMGRLINSSVFFLLIFIPLTLTIIYQPALPQWASRTIAHFYGWLSLGTIMSWWIPYFFGSSARHKAGFVEYTNTHHFLPPRGDNVIPNTFHVLMHVIIWTCFVCSIILFI